MKILFFVLGSVEKRMLENRNHSYDSLLKEDIIFFGPEIETELTIFGKKHDTIELKNQISIFKLLNELPKNWIPDIIHVETVVLNYIYDFYNCPVLTLCNSRDAWGEMIYNRKISELFDFVSYQTIDILSYSKYSCNLLPVIGTPTSIPESNYSNKPYKKRNIDVLAIANYNSGFYHNRYKLFSIISEKLGENYNIKFINGLKYNEIHNYYQDSKIVIDLSFVNSNRSYEAVINGCLFFSFEDNVLIQSVWNKNEEYIPFNLKTILNKIEFYLKNEKQANQIINNAKNKFLNLPQSPGESSLKKIEICLSKKHSINERIERIKNLNESELNYCLSTPLYFNYNYTGQNHPQNWRTLYFERINNALSSNPQGDLKVKELIEASRMAFLLNEKNKFLSYITELEKTLPEYAWIYYLKARFYKNNNEYSEAIKNLNIAIKFSKSHPDLIQKYILPFIEKNNACDGRRIVYYMWQSVHVIDESFENKTFLYLCYDLLGDIYLSKENKPECLKNYDLAVEQIPAPKTMHKFLELLIKEKKFCEAVSNCDKKISEYPYDIKSIFLYSYSYTKLKEKSKAVLLLKQLKRTYNAFENKSKYFNKLRIKKILINCLISFHWCPNSILYTYYKLTIKIFEIIR